MTSFRSFLHSRLSDGGFTTEDALSSFLPLARQVVAAHRSGLVCPLQGIERLTVDGTRILFEDADRSVPSLQPGKIRSFDKGRPQAMEVVGESRVTLEINEGQQQITSLLIGERGQPITRPVYLPGYISWEHEIGHHDPLTDVFSLGLILASLSCGLDFSDPEQVAVFVRHRRNLFDINRNL